MQVDSLTSGSNQQSYFPATSQDVKLWNQLTDYELMFQRLLGKQFQKCCKCQEGIEKTQGCDHMTCKCGQQFCYVCGGDWNNHKCSGVSKAVDNVYPGFLQIYHDLFLKLSDKNARFKEQMPETAQQLVNGQGQREENDANIIEELLNMLYWCYENLKWSQVHLFVERFQQVKDITGANQQDLTNPPLSPHYIAFNSCRFQLEQLVGNVDTTLKRWVSKSESYTMAKIVSTKESLRVARLTLIRQIDPNFTL
jgi:hypothetical protein